jgi:ferric-dicitrate binding protein FerR (iron transport regulator)
MSADEMTGSDLPSEVKSWLNEHPNADAETLREVWQLSGKVPPAIDPNPERIAAMRDALRDATTTDRLQTDTRAPAQDSPEDRGPTQRTDQTQRRWTGAIATALLVLLVAASAFLFVPLRISVPAGQTQTVSLSDGSTIQLNSGTTLRYPRWWSVAPLRSWLGRDVHLEGEAFFVVAPTEAPFRVETPNARVRVLGTRFNVRARRPDGQPKTRVVVAEGRVALSAGGATTHLDSAQAATVEGTGAPSSSETVRVDRQLAWRHGGFSFTDASIRTIAAEVERRFDVSITVQPDVETRPITLQVNDAEGAEPLLRDVCRAAGCRVDSTNTELVIRPR